MAKEKPDLVYGTLDMLILKALQHDPSHGLQLATRPRDLGPDPADVERYFARRARFALSGALPIGSARLDQGRMGRVRQQSQSALLRIDRGWTEPAVRGKGALAPHHQGNRSR